MVSGVSSNNSRTRNLAAAGAGIAVGTALPALTVVDSIRTSSPQELGDSLKFMKKLMPATDTFENVKANAEKVLEESGLKAKGVKATFITNTEESLSHLKDICTQEAGVKNSFQRKLGKNYFNIFKEGANAAFFPKANECVVHSENLYDSIFHELGHAMNKNGNVFTKALQNARVLTPFGASIVAPIALGFGIFHKVDKTKPNEEKGAWEKTKDFIANHAAGLTALSYVPMLAEEGLASIRGLKAVKPHVSKEIFGNLAKNYAKAWGTYGALAAAVTGGVAGGIALAKHIRKDHQPKAEKA